ncbi:hypothetical protein BLNAU_25187 [Blattamonas nauphoetae]|uniref:Uncharacterized protein n=1 Tax=Blattamonas nauphoetae TaxID=2049346 RepID=A0ABQ9WKB8_9EUKA|nr:hypothetical protein BLNAU_25187 [Blattamonas nauphoetae]
MWRNITPHWTSLIIDIVPILLDSHYLSQDSVKRGQSLHWLLMKFPIAAETLLKQGFARRLLEQINHPISLGNLTSALDMFFVCLHLRPVRFDCFYKPLLEAGIEDTSERILQHNNEWIANYAGSVLITHSIGSHFIPVMEFPNAYQPVVGPVFKLFVPRPEYDVLNAYNPLDDFRDDDFVPITCSPDPVHALDKERPEN